MAELLLGYDGRRYVAVKRIRGESARDPAFVKMFLEEANLAASLHHEHIVEVLHIGQHEDEYYFAMEYVHGEDLRKVLLEVNRRNDLVPVMEVVAIGCAAAAGLHHAHEKRGADRELLGIVHRDVSPANILVGYDGTVKVADFGIAKAALRQIETRSGTLKGKVSYMSPEQISGKPVDRRSDVFALGIVLYELATARRLYKGDNDFLVMTAIVEGDIPRPSTLRPDLPRPLEDIIMRALANNPGARYQTADALRCALEDYAASFGMRPSSRSITDYMKKLFGQREEPWKEATQTNITRPFEFDGSASGVVSAPSTPPARLKVAPSSPIAIMQEIAGPQGTQLAWVKPHADTGGRRSIVIGVVAALTVAVGAGAMIVATKSGAKTKAAAAPSQQPVTEAPPAPPPPVAAPIAAPAPPPAPVDDPDAAARVAQEKADAAKRAAAEAKAAEAEAKRLAAEKAAADKAAKLAADKEAKRLAAEQAAAVRAQNAAAAAEKAAAAKEAKRVAAEQAAAKDAAKRDAAKRDAAKRAAREKKAAADKPAEKKWDTKSLFPE